LHFIQKVQQLSKTNGASLASNRLPVLAQTGGQRVVSAQARFDHLAGTPRR
jgi:hypothetical protein